MICPYCRKDNDASALACESCSRDIAIPESLLAEREGLIRKRDLLRDEVLQATGKLEALRRGKKRRSA